MYSLVVLFGVVFLWGSYRRLKSYGMEHPVRDMISALRSRYDDLVRDALFQGRVVRDRKAGLLHLAIYVGAGVLLIGTLLVALDYDILRPFTHQVSTVLTGDFYLFYKVALDFFGLVFIAGVLVALFRRSFAKPPQIGKKRGYILTLLALLYLGITGYLLEALRLYVIPPSWAYTSWVGVRVSYLFGPGYLNVPIATAHLAYQVIWWSHAILTFTIVALIPFTNLLHIFTSTANTILSPIPYTPRGMMTTPFRLEELDAKGTFDVQMGVKSMKDFDWRQRLGLDACTDCGRCEAACPATAAGTPLSPRRVVQNLKSQLYHPSTAQDGALVPSVVSEDELWACTTCNACIEACPVHISPVGYILDLRRNLVFEGKLDRNKSTLLQNVARLKNSFGLSATDKEAFVNELRAMGVSTLAERPYVEYLYWIGCASFADVNSQRIVRSMVTILKHAGVSFGILGMEEGCTGDPARRLGEESRFQEIALENRDVFKKYGTRKIIAHCPHCFNTFKNEYGEFGANLEVIHHTQLIEKLMQEGKIQLNKPLAQTVTLHDSCYIGRTNGIFDAPREILKGIPEIKLVEMPRNREKSFCCGAGGCNVWYSVPMLQRDSVLRLREAVDTKAGVMAVECPYCLQMFQDAVRVEGKEQSFPIRDVAEIIAESIE
jgi:Fe-S oxidoreductase/nitrate reductase gamma subunit